MQQQKIADGGARGKFRQGVASEIGLVFAGNSGRIRVGGRVGAVGRITRGELPRGKYFAWRKNWHGGFRVERIPRGRESRVGGEGRRLGGMRRGEIIPEKGVKIQHWKFHVELFPHRENTKREKSHTEKITRSITNYVCKEKCNKSICIDTGLYGSYRPECLFTVLQFPALAKRIIQNRSSLLPRQTF